MAPYACAIFYEHVPLLLLPALILAHYWSASKRSSCPVKDDSQGITLHSLGGIFVIALVGFAAAAVAMGVEVAVGKNSREGPRGRRGITGRTG